MGNHSNLLAAKAFTRRFGFLWATPYLQQISPGDSQQWLANWLGMHICSDRGLWEVTNQYLSLCVWGLETCSALSFSERSTAFLVKILSSIWSLQTNGWPHVHVSYAILILSETSCFCASNYFLSFATYYMNRSVFPITLIIYWNYNPKTSMLG